MTREPLPPTYSTTREELRRLACHVIAPARKAAEGRIGLRPWPGGFGTPPFGPSGSVVRIESDGVEVRLVTDERAEPLTSLAEAAALAGVDLSDDPGVGHDVPELGDVHGALDIDAPAALALAGWYEFGESVLGRFSDELTLWPEHFDLAFQLAEQRVNVGASPGDGFSEEPYLYVGPWEPVPGDDDFWNAPFGAVLSYSALRSADDPHVAGQEFVARGIATAAPP